MPEYKPVDLTDKTCIICEEKATNIFYGKFLCADHYELSRH